MTDWSEIKILWLSSKYDAFSRLVSPSPKLFVKEMTDYRSRVDLMILCLLRNIIRPTTDSKSANRYFQFTSICHNFFPTILFHKIYIALCSVCIFQCPRNLRKTNFSLHPYCVFKQILANGYKFLLLQNAKQHQVLQKYDKCHLCAFAICYFRFFI